MIRTIDPSKLLQALGLSPRAVELVQLLGGEAAHAQGPRAPARQSFDSMAHAFEVGLPPAFGWPGARLLASADRPQLYLLESSSAPLRTRGIVELLPEKKWLFDARESPASAVFADGHVVLALPSGLLVGRRADPVRYRLAPDSSRGAIPDGIQAPEWLDDQNMPSWLFEAAQARWNEPGLYSLGVAAGLVGRLWTPAADAMAAASDLLAGNGLAADVQRWFAKLRENERRSSTEQACWEVERLRSELPRLERISSRGSHGSRRDLRRWLLGRDDVESFAFLLGETRPGSDLELELRHLDECAQSYFSLFSQIKLGDDPRMRTVARLEPESWWGMLAVP